MTKKCLLNGCNEPARIKFCSNKHKDRYHNLNNPRGKFAHLNPSSLEYMDDNSLYDEHPFSSEGLGQWID